MSICKNIRNFGIIAHIDAGKTTTTERILYLSGANYRIGEVDDGTTTTDWMLEEKEHGITITAAAVSCNWNEKTFHIIDTPGHIDFNAEVQRSLRVLDGAVVVFCGVSGVQTQSETVWHQADNYNIPRIVYINKLDRLGANFENVLKEIQDKFKITTISLSIPYYENDLLTGIIDIIKMKKISFTKDGKIDNKDDIPINYASTANKYRDELINILTSLDDNLLELALNNTLSEDQIIKSIKVGLLKKQIVPVIAGASYRNIGVPILLDAIANYLPSPDDVEEVKGYFIKKDSWETIKLDPEGMLVGYVFKVQYHREKGLLAFVRLYSGKINNGSIVFNPRTKKKERVLDLLQVYADKYERIEAAQAGDIITIAGCKFTVTSDTLCNEAHQVALETLKFPEPVIYIRVEPKNAVDKEKLNTAKEHLLMEDPTIMLIEDNDTGQTLIGGMGELHIEIFLERLKNAYGIYLNSGAPQVAYKETPRKAGEYIYEFDKKIDGNIQHVKLALSIEPAERTKGNIISSSLHKKDFAAIPNIEAGINSALRSGPDGAYPLIDCKVNIISIDYDSSRSTPAAIEACASLCTSFLLREVGTILLEPIMKLEINIPTQFTGNVIGELQSRGGIVMDIIKKINQDIVYAKAPLKSMFGYTTSLRSLTQGKGSFSMEYLLHDTSFA